MSDYDKSPEWLAWEKHIRIDTIPKIDDSAITISIVPETTDIKFAVELGLSIMMDKPIVLMVAAGMKIPDKLVRLADGIVEWDPDSPMDQQTQVREKIAKYLKDLTGDDNAD